MTARRARRSGKKGGMGWTTLLIVLFLCVVSLESCSQWLPTPEPTPTKTPTITASPTVTATPTLWNTFVPIDTVEATATGQIPETFYAVEDDFYFLPPTSWTVQKSYYDGRFLWNNADQSESFYFRSDSWTGSFESYLDEYKRVNRISSLPHLKYFPLEEILTDSGITTHKFSFQFTTDDENIFITLYFLQSENKMLGFMYQRKFTEPSEPDPVIEECVKTVNWLFEE